MSDIEDHKLIFVFSWEYKYSNCLLLQDILVKGKTTLKPSIEKGSQDEIDTAFEKVNKDLNALTAEEQMDVVYRLPPDFL